jgi:uncharacterized membrane protein
MTGERLATAATVGVGVIWSNGLVKDRGLTKFIVAAPSAPFSFLLFSSLSNLIFDLLIGGPPTISFSVASATLNALFQATFFHNKLLCIINISC